VVQSVSAQGVPEIAIDVMLRIGFGSDGGSIDRIIVIDGAERFFNQLLDKSAAPTRRHRRFEAATDFVREMEQDLHGSALDIDSYIAIDIYLRMQRLV
jgi:hypothetical protein